MKHMQPLMIGLVLSAVMLSVFLPWHQDELVFIEIGNALSSELLPYRDFFDNKLPSIYVVASLLPQDLVNVRVFMIVVHGLVSFGLWQLLGKRSQSERAWTVFLYLLMAIHYQGAYLMTESFVGLGLVYAVLFWKRRQLFLSGLFFGLALVFKQSVWLLSIVAFVYLLLRNMRWNFMVGAALPVMGMLWWVYMHNLGGAFWEHAIYGVLFSYVPDSVRVFEIDFSLLWPLMVMLYMARKNLRQQHVVAIWLSAYACVQIFVRPYHHYILQGLPFMAYLCGIGGYGRRERYLMIVSGLCVFGGTFLYVVNGL